MINRRNFLQSGSLGLASVPFLSLPKIADLALPKQVTVLFQGDSITDAGRNRAHYYPNLAHGMGNGYAFHAATHLMGEQPETDWKIYNRGISGHKVFELSNRWENDALQLKPDVLSILIGVNDYWHTLSYDYKGTVEVYKKDFTNLLERTTKTLPNVKLLIGAPFFLAEGTAIQKDKWQSAFPAYQAAALQIAKSFDATFIPYQKVFNEALETADTAYWCPDGVHPSMAGNYLMAKAWLKGFRELFQ
ncbi:MAG: SGNH/GDSL hydrolase family protein [Bacteroidota bacterium]